MKTKTLIAAVAAFIPALVASVPADAEPRPVRPIAIQPQVKIKTDLTLAGNSAVPGEKKAFDVLLADATGKPVAGKTVQLVVAPKAGGPALVKPITVGDVQTGANGHAILTWSCVDLVQGSYDLHATFAGDAGAMPSSATANFFVAKAQATYSLGDLMWGTYKNEPGSPSGTIMVKLTRTSDQKGLDKPMTITVNGKAWQISTQYGFAEIALMPLNAKSWDVKLQFDGDDYTIATAAERHYTHP